MRCVKSTGDSVQRNCIIFRHDWPLGHSSPALLQVFYLAAADTEGGRDLESGVRHRCGDTVPVRRERLTRPDASGIDCSKAHRMLGWTPRLTWRDYLNDQGRLKQTPANGWF